MRFCSQLSCYSKNWMEGLTVAAIILGAIFGGLLIGHRVEDQVVQQLGGLEFNGGIDASPEFVIFVILSLYLVAAVALKLDLEQSNRFAIH